MQPATSCTMHAHSPSVTRASRCMRLHALRLRRSHRRGTLGLPDPHEIRKALKDTAVAAIAESLRGEVLHHDPAKLPDMTVAIAVLVMLRLLRRP